MSTPKISILMSTYNETESDIRESVESMLRQTFTDYEMIVVNDNPKREDVKAILDSYNDSRIIFYQNPTNIGLAMSMNKAAEIAKAHIYARMDADDIAETTRLEKEYELLKTGKYDFIFTDYNYIDEKSQLITEKTEHTLYKPEELSNVLARVNVIHHPTVMFTKAIFDKVGGYRNFPCSQDADLWFRMQEAACRFYMIPEKLLRYRINTNSVSNKRWYQQQLTCNYIYDLSIERLESNGKDSYSLEGYNAYLQKWGCGKPEMEAKLRKAYSYLSKAIKLRTEGKFVEPLLLRIWVFISSPYMRMHTLNIKRKEKLLKNIEL